MRIAAVNEFGEGEKSQIIMVRTPNGGPRDSPRITHIDGIANRSMVVHWTAPRKPQGNIKKYQLWWQQMPNDLWHLTELEGDRRQYNLGSSADLGYGETIRMKIAAVNERNIGPTSDVATAVSWNPFLPTPSNVTAVLRNSTLYIKFNPGSDAKVYCFLMGVKIRF